MSYRDAKITAKDVASSQPIPHKPHFYESGAGRSLERLIKRSSLVGDRAFFDTEDFPWAREIETEWCAIRAELDNIMQERDRMPAAHVVAPRSLYITQDDNWKNFYLICHGYRASANCEKCVETTRLVENIPDMLTAHFSILGPGAHVTPHRGRFNGVLKCQLGLIVPQPADACWIRVAEDVMNWREGKTIIFDDTYEHEVQNNTDGWRVVLIVEFLRPLPFPVSSINKTLAYLMRMRSSIRTINDYLEKHE